MSVMQYGLNNEAGAMATSAAEDAGPSLHCPPGAVIHDRWVQNDMEFTLRTVHASDKQLMLEGFDRLSDETKEKRFFFIKKELRPEELKFLTEVDMVKHYAVCVTIPDPTDPTKEYGVAVSRFITMSSKPDTAELAFAVLDGFQGQGIGTRMLHQLVLGAQRSGLKSLQCEILPFNYAMRRLVTSNMAGSKVRQNGEDILLSFPVPHPDTAAQAAQAIMPSDAKAPC